LRAVPAEPRPGSLVQPVIKRSCATCGETSMFSPRAPRRRRDRADHYLVDGRFRDTSAAGAAGGCSRPALDGARWHLARYRWNTQGFGRVGSAPWPRCRRSRCGAYRAGAARPNRGVVARAYRFPPFMTAGRRCLGSALRSRCCRSSGGGSFAGREVSVLMTRLPMTSCKRASIALGQRIPSVRRCTIPGLADRGRAKRSTMLSHRHAS
jgi:hypothetical protein